jgi:hypothetical protein
MDRNRSRGLRDSRWNRDQDQGLYFIRKAGLTLDNSKSALPSSPVRREPRGPGLASSGLASSGQGTASALGYYVAPWLAPVARRYHTANQPLMRVLDWITTKTWVLALLDQQSRWLEEGSAGCRISMGCSLAGILALLFSLQWQPLYPLQAITWLPVFAGHGVMVLLGAAFLIGATVVPPVLGHVIPVVLRLYVLVSLGTMAGLLGYGLWLLFSWAR